MIETAIDSLLQRLEHSELLTEKAKLYSVATKVKFAQARWSLEILREMEHLPDIKGDATSQDILSRISTTEKIVFICECFWDFLRSSIDIEAQIVNELKSLNLDEDNVSLSAVRAKMMPTLSMTLLFKALINCERSWAFNELNSYRHCSTHRRQVEIFQLPSSPSPQPITGVYAYMDGFASGMNRYLCVNPSCLRPQANLKKPLVEHNERILKEIERRLSTIINRLP